MTELSDLSRIITYALDLCHAGLLKIKSVASFIEFYRTAILLTPKNSHTSVLKG